MSKPGSVPNLCCNLRSQAQVIELASCYSAPDPMKAVWLSTRDSRMKIRGGAMRKNEFEYLKNREQAERAAARNAASDAARRAHQELADNYAELLRREP